MGLLDAAIGFASGVGETGQKIGLASIQADIDQQKQERVAELTASLQQQTHAANLVAETAAQDQRRKTMVDSTNSAADQFAQDRANRNNVSVGTQAEAAANAYQNSSLSDEDKQTGLLAAGQYAKDNTIGNPTRTDSDVLRARVNAGYESPMDMVKMDKMDAQNLIQNRLAAIKEQHEQNWTEAQAAKDDTRNRQVDAMFARIGAAASGGEKSPAAVQTAEWISENVKDDNGNSISKTQAWKMVKTAAERPDSDTGVKILTSLLQGGFVDSKNPMAAVGTAQAMTQQIHGATGNTPTPAGQIWNWTPDGLKLTNPTGK